MKKILQVHKVFSLNGTTHKIRIKLFNITVLSYYTKPFKKHLRTI